MSTPPPAGDLPFTTWGRRTGAIAIDYVVLALFLFAVRTLLGLGDVQRDDGSFRVGEAVATLALSLVTITLYFTVAVARSGRTVGKAVFGCRTVTTDGRLPPVPVALERAVVQAVGFVTCVLAVVDGLWALSDPRHQALHDKVAGTVVIDA